MKQVDELEAPGRHGTEEDGGLTWPLVRVAVSFLAMVAAGAVFVAWHGGSLAVDVLIVFAAGLLTIRFQRVTCAEVGRRHDRWPYRLIAGGLTATGVLCIVAWYLWRPDGALLLGAAGVYVGVGMVLDAARSGPAPPSRAAAVLLAASGIATFVSLVAAAFGIGNAWSGVAIGLLTAPIGISLASEVVLRRMARWPTRTAAISGALAALALAAVIAVIEAQGLQSSYATLLGVGLALALLGMAARSSIDVVFVLAAAAVVWALGHSTVPVPPALDPQAGDRTLVALGDSFISGEGADEFFDGTNTPGVSTCRRAPTAYPVLLLAERGLPADRLSFLACSGAKAHQVASDREGTQMAQLADSAVDRNDVELVLLSIGGNDALFGTISRACLLPIDCTPLADAWADQLAGVSRTLDRTYREVRRELPRARILVVPYPVPLAPSGCPSSAFTDDEHAFLNMFTRQLDTVITDAAHGARLEVVSTMPTALRDLRLCDPAPEGSGVNFLAANSVIGTLEQSLDPTNWVHNSLHPNARGHDAMRAALATYLEQNPEPPPLPPASATPPSVTTVASLTAGDDGPCVGETNAALDACASTWMAERAARLVLVHQLLLVPALLAAWALALAAVHLWSSLFPPNGRPGIGQDS